MVIKSLYQDPKIYNFTVRGLADKIDCAPATLSRHIKILKEKNLISIHYGNLCVKGIRATLDDYNRRVVINLPVSKIKRDNLAHLRSVIVIQNLNNQKNRINKSLAIVNLSATNAFIPKKVCREVQKSGGLAQMKKNTVDRITLSNRGFGLLFNRCQSTGKAYQRRLNEVGAIKSSPCLVVLRSDIHKEILRYNSSPKIWVTSENQLVMQVSNTIWFPFSHSERMYRERPAGKSLSIAEEVVNF